MNKYILLVIAFLGLQGCMGHSMTKEQRASIQTVSIASITEIEDEPTMKMVGDEAVREYLINTANIEPSQLSSNIDKNYERYFQEIGFGKNDVSMMLTDAFDAEMREKNAFPEVLRSDKDADAILKITVHSWGFGGVPFSSKQKPYLLLTVQLLGKNGEDYFRTVRSIDVFNEALTSQSPETMYNNTDLVRASLKESANLAAKLIITDLVRVP